MQLELCAFSLEACRVATQAGADRLELCSGRAEGGLTPSIGLIRLARQQTHLSLYVMIRPRGGDFLYDEAELAVMKADIEAAKQAGADGLVFGLLRADGTVDTEQLRPLLDLAYPLPVTFHRAFDMSRDPHEALDTLIELGVRRVLTSGQQPTAEAGLPLLQALTQQANSRIEIMAGSGITTQNAGLFVGIGLSALHLTAKRTSISPMQFRRASLSMAASLPDEYERVEADLAYLQRVKGQM